MLLFHGSNVEVREPRLVAAIHTLDFGPGFYTTANFDQAVDFARKVVDRNDGRGKPIVTVFSFDDEQTKDLTTRRFERPSDEWLDFVSSNRQGVYAGPVCDLTIGPVANDNVYQTIQLYLAGVLTREQAIDAMKVRKLFNQYVFSSERSLAMLRYVRSEVMT